MSCPRVAKSDVSGVINVNRPRFRHAVPETSWDPAPIKSPELASASGDSETTPEPKRRREGPSSPNLKRLAGRAREMLRGIASTLKKGGKEGGDLDATGTIDAVLPIIEQITRSLADSYEARIRPRIFLTLLAISSR